MALSFKQASSAFRTYALFVVLLVVSLVLVTVYAREGEHGVLHGIQSGVSGAFAPLKVVSGGISAAEDSAGRALADATADADTLAALREQNQQLRDSITQLEEYRQQAQRLQGLLGLKDKYAAQGVAAHVLARPSDSWNQIVTLDKGTREGIRTGLPVVGASGLIGQVVSANPYTSDVRLLQDAQSGVAVMIQSSRVEGILRGSLDGLLYLENVPDDAEVKTGDVVITSGLGGGYFRGITVGTVVKVEGNTGSTNRKIVVDANDSVGAVEEVLVVTGMDSDKASAAAAQDAELAAQATPDDQAASSGADAGTSSAGDATAADTGAADSGSADAYGTYSTYGTDGTDAASGLGTQDATGSASGYSAYGYDTSGANAYGYDTNGASGYDDTGTYGYDVNGTYGYDETGTYGYGDTGSTAYGAADTTGSWGLSAGASGNEG